MKQLLRTVVSITLLAIAVWMFDWNKLIATAARVSPAVYGLALALSFLHFLPMFLRWSYLVRGAAPSSLLHHGGVYFYGSFLNTFTPANLGGDIYRVAQLRTLSGSQKILSALLRERFIGLVGLEVGFLLFYIAMNWAGSKGAHQPLMQISAAIIVAALIATLLAPWLIKCLPRREGSRMERLLEGLHAAIVFSHARALLLLILLSLLALALWVAAIDVLACNLSLGLSFGTIGAVAVLTELVRLVPISLQGIGVREGTFAFLAALCGARPETAFVVATLAFLALSLSLAVCGATGWILEQIRQRHEGKLDPLAVVPRPDIGAHRSQQDVRAREKMIRVGLIGYGYWGPNLFRNFQSNPHFKIVAVADAREARREQLRRQAPDLKLYVSGEEIVSAPDIDAVVIATPVATHFPLASQAMKKGKHVLVEKPMCASIAEGEEMIAIAKSAGVTLMVDHTFLFTGAVMAMRDLCRSGEMGKISYYDSMRINLGLFQPDVNVMWDLAPHDFSIMDYILDEEPVHVEASGYCHVNPGMPDIAYLTMHFPSDMIAHFNLSWMSPVKMRRTAIGGSKKMLVWDDLNPEEKIKIYNSGIELQPEAQRAILIPDYRIGDIFSPRLDRREALAGVVDHFASAIDGKIKPIMGGDAGLRVVRMLEMAQHSLDRSFGGNPANLRKT